MNSFLKSFIYAFNGLKLSLVERNKKVLVFCGFFTIALGFFFNITVIEWCLVLICIGIVLALETINTAIEFLVNLVEPDYNHIAGKIKDLAAGAVLIFSIFSAMVAFLIFGKYILDLLHNF